MEYWDNLLKYNNWKINEKNLLFLLISKFGIYWLIFVLNGLNVLVLYFGIIIIWQCL